jgi:glycosyltransferase involved in cell wall biosynthesis
MVERFRPDLIWLENYTPALPAMHLSLALGLPLYYRSHNVEYMYARAITTSMGSMSLRQRLIRYLVERDLDRFERKLLKHAHKVYDISRDDRIFWKSELPNLPITWLPPMIDETITIPQREKTIDFLFIGNLFTANNIEALHWLIESVMPQVRNSLPHARLLVAGSNPEDSFLSYLSGCDGVDLLRDFPSQEELLARSRVVVNPALRGSGITIKTVDALYSGTPWVGTTQAVRGLPEPLRRLLHPTDDAHLFAARMVSLYHTPENYPSKEILGYCIEYFHALPVRILSQLPETLQ